MKNQPVNIQTVSMDCRVNRMELVAQWPSVGSHTNAVTWSHWQRSEPMGWREGSCEVGCHFARLLQKFSMRASPFSIFAILVA